MLYRERERIMRHNLCDLIGELAGVLMLNRSEEEWPQFKESVLKLFWSADTLHIESAFLTLEAFVGFSPDLLKADIPNLYSIFLNGLQHANAAVALSALKCASTFMASVNSKEAKKLLGLLGPIFECTYRLFKQDDGEDALEALADLVESEPKLLKNHIAPLFQLVMKFFQESRDQGLRKMALEMLVGLADNLPSIFRKEKERRTCIVELVFMNMVDISTEISKEWMSPPEGFNDDEGDDDKGIIDYGLECIDRLIESVGETEMIGVLSETVNKMF